MNNNLAYFLGLWVAEGSFEENIYRISITCGDSDIGDFLMSGAAGVDFTPSPKRTDQWRTNSIQLLEMMRFLNMPLVKAPQKWIPEWVWAGKREWAEHFLSGMFDGDGYICSGRNKAGYTTASEQLAKDVQLLLTNFGIMSRLSSVISKPTELVSVESRQYRVEILGKNVSLLKDVLHLRIKRKADNLAKISSSLVSRNDGVKVLNLLEGLKKHFVGRKGSLDIALIAAKRGSKTSYESIGLILSECSMAATQSDYRALKKIFEDHYFWDEVTSVEKSEADTCDFTIPDTHSFWTNGFISHNTPKAYNYLYEVYKNGARGEYYEDEKGRLRKNTWMSWQFPTITSPFIPISEIESAKHDMDDKSFKQEFEACHLPETEVVMWGGKVKQIQHIEAGELVQHLNPEGYLEPAEVIAIGKTGVKCIIEATLETGEVISASAHHKFKVHV